MKVLKVNKSWSIFIFQVFSFNEYDITHLLKLCDELLFKKKDILQFHMEEL
jgi:hypothetical protein